MTNQKYRLSIIGIGTLAFLSACAFTPPTPPFDFNDTQAVASRISSDYDNFKKVTTYEAPSIILDGGFLYHPYIFIRAWKYDKGDISYQIYFYDDYLQDWKFYNSAYDLDGNSLDIIKIKSDVHCLDGSTCEHVEKVGINLSRALLEKYQIAGQSFKVSGTSGEKVFFIPAGYFKAVLATVNGEKIVPSGANHSAVPSNLTSKYRPLTLSDFQQDSKN